MFSPLLDLVEMPTNHDMCALLSNTCCCDLTMTNVKLAPETACMEKEVSFHSSTMQSVDKINDVENWLCRFLFTSFPLHIFLCVSDIYCYQMNRFCFHSHRKTSFLTQLNNQQQVTKTVWRTICRHVTNWRKREKFLDIASRNKFKMDFHRSPKYYIDDFADFRLRKLKCQNSLTSAIIYLFTLNENDQYPVITKWELIDSFNYYYLRLNNSLSIIRAPEIEKDIKAIHLLLRIFNFNSKLLFEQLIMSRSQIKGKVNLFCKRQ